MTHRNNNRSIEIRMLTGEDEVELLEQHMPYPGDAIKYRKCFTLQQENKASYIVAWRDSLPVGHALIKFDPVLCRFSDCQELEDLFVTPEFQKRGIGTQILLFAENLVMQHKGNKIGLAVDVNNNAARELYERLGYLRNSRIQVTFTEFDANNKLHEITLDCYYYIKTLS